MTRADKIALLKDKAAKEKPATLGDMLSLAAGIAVDIEATLKKGVDINDLDVLLDRLEGIGDLKASVDELREAIKLFPEIPEEIKIANVNEFLEAIKSIKVEVPEITLPEQKETPQPDYTGAVKQMSNAIVQMAISTKALAPKPQSQKAADYVPFRRVIRDGNTFKFDDNQTSGGGGGVGANIRGLIGGLDYNYIEVTQTSATVETYIYKLGGSGGTTIRTIVVTYTDATKADIDKVEYS